MSFTLYNYVLSGLLAALLEVSYETVAIDFHPGKEHQREPFLALNPAATLPVLVRGETILTETQAIRLHSMLNKTINVAAAASASITVLRELESHLTEQRLMDVHWLAADHPTVADIACFAYAALSPDAGIEHDEYPAIRTWMHALRSLDGFITMPGIYELHELRSEQGERL